MPTSSYTFDPLLREYLENHGRLTADKMAEIARQGRLPGCAPVGYRNALDARGGRVIVIDPDAAPLIREAFELVEEGLSPREIAERLTARGLRSRGGRVIAASGMWAILQNPFYVGKIRFHFTVLPGSHEPIIAGELFKRVQQVLQKRGRV